MGKKILQIIIAIFILVSGILVSVYIIRSKPKPPARRKEIPSFMVRTVVARPSNFTYTVETTGTVVSPRMAEIASEVPGRIVYVSPKLLPGEMVEKGELLICIDKTNYIERVERARLEVKKAERILEETLAEAERSRAEWRMVHPKKPPPPLVAKVPQVEEAKALLSYARATLKRALKDLERTEIRSPFKARVLKVSVEVGDYASPGKVLTVVYPLSGLEILSYTEDLFLPYIKVPGFNSVRGSPADVFWEMGKKRYLYHGKVVRAGGKIDEKTRLFPLYIKAESKENPPLLPGAFVSVNIKGRTFKSVFVLPRESLHRTLGKAFVWLVKGGRLIKRDVNVIYEGEEKVVVEGLRDGDVVVAQRLRGATPGTLVKVRR